MNRLFALRFLAAPLLALAVGCADGKKQSAPAEPAPATSAAPVAATPAEAAASQPAPAQPLTAGQAAPEFQTVAHDGTAISMKALRGKPVVLYFYPKDETPG